MIEKIPGARLVAFARDVVQTLGMSPDDAAMTADALVWRDYRDEIPAGIPALHSCITSIRNGTTKADVRPAVTQHGGATVVEAGHAWGQVTLTIGMRAAIAAAKTSGIGVAMIRDSSTANAMGYFPTLAIAEGLIGLVVTNSYAQQAPWGGTEKVLGNQAWAFGAPAGRHMPVLFDAASTAISVSRIRALQRRGEPLPEGVALDASGAPTIDHEAAIAGIMLPAGGHKGYALSVMWEILTGVLSGSARFGQDVRKNPGEPMDTSMFALAIDPAVSMPIDEFTARVDALVDQIHASPPAPGVARVYAPGERGYLVEAERRRDGIPLPAARLAELAKIGEEAGVAW